MGLKENICQKLASCLEWSYSLSDCEPGIYGVSYWEVFLDPEDINIVQNNFTFENAYFCFQVQMFASNDGIVTTFSKVASGKGNFDISANQLQIFNIEVDYNKSLFPGDEFPLLGKYSLDDLKKLYRENNAIPEKKY
jgi:hypothetical protein